MKRNIIYISTLAIPMIILFIYMFVSNNSAYEIITSSPHVILEDFEEDYDFIVDEENIIEINNEDLTMTITYEKMSYNNIEVEGKMTVPITEMFSIQENYYNVDEDGNLVVSDISALIKDSLFVRSFSIGMSVILSFVGLFLGVVVIFKKTDAGLKHKRLSALMSLSLLTFILLFLSQVTNQITSVLLVLDISFGVYYLEWRRYRKIDGLPPYEGVVVHERRE